MNNTYYKYRSLENFKHFVDIILNKRLYAAHYKDLNDPMEGLYYYQNSMINEDIKDKLLRDKNELRICSLSRDENNPLMWSHYADGHRGVVIELEVNENYNKEDIEYTGLPRIYSNIEGNKTATYILKHKIDIWKYEKETRVFIKEEKPNEVEKFVNVNVKKITTGAKMCCHDHDFIKELVREIAPSIIVTKA